MKINFDSEKELEDLICERLDQNFNPITNQHCTHYERQLNLGPYGIADIVTFDSDMELYDIDGVVCIHAKVFELKKEFIKPDAIAQAARYKRGLQHLFRANTGMFECADVGSVECHVVGTGIDDAVYMQSMSGDDPCFFYHEAVFDPAKGLSFSSHEGPWSSTEFDPDFWASKCESLDDYISHDIDYHNAHKSKNVEKIR